MADDTYSLTYRPRERTHWLILHDSHTVPGQKSMIEWLKVMGRKAGLLSIGYHYVIFEDGELVSCRPAHTQGSHCRGFNKESIGVCLIGGLRIRPGEDGEEIKVHADTFTPEQKARVAELYAYLKAQYPELTLKAHTEMGQYVLRSTPCPAISNMDEIRCSLP